MADDAPHWQSLYESERAELQRSERVQQQLKDVLGTLKKRNDDLSTQNERLRAEARSDPCFAALESELASRRQELEAKEEEHGAFLREAAAHRQAAAEHEGLAEARREAIAEAERQTEQLECQRQRADARREEASVRARSMISADTLHRVSDEATKLRTRLEEHEAEAAKLRQALIDSWAARGDPDAPSKPSSALQDLDGVEEELKWLTTMQQEDAAERHHMQSLERQEASLQRKLRELSEDKALLQSARVDLGTAGATLRETVASQSEGWVRRVDDLEQQRRTTDQDRVKLLNECADLQARWDNMAPELQSIQELEERHNSLEADRRRLENESQRLQDVNGALGVLLLGSDAPPPPPTGDGDDAGAVAEAITRVLTLQRRLIERQEAQTAEKEKLADRIRELERQASQPDASPLERRPKAKAGSGGGGFASAARGGAGAGPASSAGGALGGGALASAGSAMGGALKGGLGKLREAAASAVL